MHELSMCNAIINRVRTAAEKNNCTRILSVTLEIGALHQIIPEIMDTAWQTVSNHTCADGSTLIIKTIPLTLHCHDCNAEYCIHTGIPRCPTDGTHQSEIIHGKEMNIISFEGE